MDQAMHRHWLAAERRIDGALAGITFCALWFLALPITVLLTDLTWNSQFSMALMVAIPVAIVFVGFFLSTLRVVKAIEERDQEELARWRSSGTPPREPGLLRQRLHRDHYPMLCVIASVSIYIVALAVIRLPQVDYRAMGGYTLGILLVGAGVGLGAIALATPLTSRAKLWALVLVGWAVPAGAVLCSLALIFGSNEIARAVYSPTMTSFVYVILGIIVLLVALSLIALWLAWFSRAVRGQGLFNHVQARALFETLPEEDLVPDRVTAEKTPASFEEGNGAAPSQFDEVDVDIVANVLRHPRKDLVLALVIVAATGGILLLSFMGYAGTPYHGAVAAILLGTCLAYVYRVWKVF
ncbi:hypothetical protein VR010_00440 [Actinomycetaceae bacterium L2_0104]